MGKRSDDIQALIARCEADLAKIETKYRESLHAQEVSSDLKVDIKNFCENLRSVLDYLAHDIRDKYCAGADPRTQFYFPILSSEAKFKTKVATWYPGLHGTAPDLWAYLESVQPYHSSFMWFGVLNRVNNENKHGKLVAQTRTETEQVRVSFPCGSVSWSPDNIRFGPGVSIGGVPVDSKTQMPVPDPSQKVQRIAWVDFRFAGENISALGLLKDANAGVKDIAVAVGQWL